MCYYNNMKIFLVADHFQGTDNDGDGYSIDSAWLDENVAHAVAASRYAHSVMDVDVDETNEVPAYAQAAYDHLIAWRKKNPKKSFFDWSYAYKYKR